MAAETPPPGPSRRRRIIFDLGICLVLLSLPIMALYVAIQMLLGRKKFTPPGAWIDEALVLWVLIALVVAMVMYIVAWHRYSE